MRQEIAGTRPTFVALQFKWWPKVGLGMGIMSYQYVLCNAAVDLGALKRALCCLQLLTVWTQQVTIVQNRNSYISS